MVNIIKTKNIENNNSSTVTEMNISVDYNGRKESILQLAKIVNSNGQLVMNTIDMPNDISYWAIGRIVNFDNSQLIVHMAMTGYSDIYILNTDNFTIRYITNGRGTSFKEGNEIRIKVEGLKAYHDGGGAYWYDAIYDLDGNLIKLLSTESEYKSLNCIPVKDIINVEKHPSFTQSPDDCVYVD